MCHRNAQKPLLFVFRSPESDFEEILSLKHKPESLLDGGRRSSRDFSLCGFWIKTSEDSGVSSTMIGDYGKSASLGIKIADSIKLLSKSSRVLTHQASQQVARYCSSSENRSTRHCTFLNSTFGCLYDIMNISKFHSFFVFALNLCQKKNMK